jgi:hypothetical protein
MYLLPLNFGLNGNFFFSRHFQIKTEHLPHTQAHFQETKQQSSIHVAGCETLQVNIFLHIEERNIPLAPETLRITAFLLLECKKWA